MHLPYLCLGSFWQAEQVRFIERDFLLVWPCTCVSGQQAKSSDSCLAKWVASRTLTPTALLMANAGVYAIVLPGGGEQLPQNRWLRFAGLVLCRLHPRSTCNQARTHQGSSSLMLGAHFLVVFSCAARKRWMLHKSANGSSNEFGVAYTFFYRQVPRHAKGPSSVTTFRGAQSFIGTLMPCNFSCAHEQYN